MKHTEVTVRQVVQKRQFEPLDITISALMEDGDDLNQVINQLKQEVAQALAGTPQVAPVPQKAAAKVTQTEDNNF